MNSFIALAPIIIIAGGFWVWQARKNVRIDARRAAFWLGPIQAVLFRSLIKKSPEKQDSYVLAIGIGNIVIAILLLALLTFL